MKIIPSKRNVYVGEQLVSELKIYTSVNTSPTGGLKEVPYECFYKYSLDADQVSSRENINGKIHVTQVLQRHVLIPQKAGSIVIEPYTSEWTIPQRITSNRRSGNIFDDFFNDPFSDPFDRYRNVPVEITTDPVTINVKPLPENVPEGFTGAVGDFTFKANLSTNNLKVNDALSLVVTISGTGNISLISPPEIDFPPDHDVYEVDRTEKISTSGNRISGNVTYEYPIVVRHAGNFRIAPISFTWFDPSLEKYKTITTDEFRFTVEKGQGPDQSAQVYSQGMLGDDVENIGTDILDINRAIPVFRVIGKTPLTNNLYWFLYGIIVLVFIVLVILLRTWFRQRADIQLLRNKKAAKIARSRLKTADKARRNGDEERFFEEAEKAIWGYLSDKLGIEISSLSRDSVAGILRNAGIKEKLEEDLRRIIDDCEFSRYAPSSEKSDMNELYEDSVRLLRSLEHNIRSK